MQILSIKLYFHCFIAPQLLLFIFPDLAHGKNRGHLRLLKMPLKLSTHLLLNFWVTSVLGKTCRPKKQMLKKILFYSCGNLPSEKPRPFQKSSHLNVTLP